MEQIRIKTVASVSMRFIDAAPFGECGKLRYHLIIA